MHIFVTCCCFSILCYGRIAFTFFFPIAPCSAILMAFFMLSSSSFTVAIARRLCGPSLLTKELSARLEKLKGKCIFKASEIGNGSINQIRQNIIRILPNLNERKRGGGHWGECFIKYAPTHPENCISGPLTMTPLRSPPPLLHSFWRRKSVYYGISYF